MSENIITTTSAEETKQLAAQWAQKIKPHLGTQPIVFALEGELGTGKTQFVKGMAASLGYQKLVTSPSYSLVNEYPLPSGKLMVHIDAWRLPSPAQDLLTLGWEQFLNQQALIMLEWPPDVNYHQLAPQAWWIKGLFAYVENQKDSRLIRLEELS